MADLLFTLNIVAPVFLTIFVGYGLKRIGLFTEDFTERVTKLLFHVGFPALIVTEMARSDLGDPAYANAGLLFAAATLVVVGLGLVLARLLVAPRSRGAFVQGAFRGNLVLVGLPLVSRALGPDALTGALVIIAFGMPLYNALAVFLLTPAEARVGWPALVREVAKNPLILALVVGASLSLLGLRLPEFLDRTGSYLGQMSLPLALLSIGASMRRRALATGIRDAAVSTALKTLLCPLLVYLASCALGVSDRLVATLTILAATPTAVASYIMARAMRADHELAGAIVVLTTLASALTVSAVIYTLRALGLV